jgi:hypothetical protein
MLCAHIIIINLHLCTQRGPSSVFILNKQQTTISVRPRTSDCGPVLNFKSCITWQLHVGSYSTFKLEVRGPNQSVKRSQMKTTCIGRRPQILKGEYLSNHLSLEDNRETGEADIVESYGGKVDIGKAEDIRRH